MNKNIFKADNFFDISNFRFQDIFDGINFPWEALPKINGYIKQQFKKGIYVANYKDRNDVFIGKGTTIQKGAEIIGPAIIGENCVIGHASLLRENCLIGDNVNIGHAVEVKNSVFLNNCVVAHLNYIGDGIVGNNVNISGGAILANFRFDKKPVSVKVKDKRIDTGLQKFSAIIGDGSMIGVNAVLNPGTILGKNTIVYPLVSVVGAHQDEEIINKKNE